MACIPPDTAVLTHKKGPRALVATWTYLGNSHIGFHVDLDKLDPTTNKWNRYKRRYIFENARNFTFKKLHLGLLQAWRVTVYTRCADCSVTDGVVSDTIVINGEA